MEYLLSWIKELIILTALFTFMEILIPSGPMAKYVKFIFSLIILAVLLEPIQLLI